MNEDLNAMLKRHWAAMGRSHPATIPDQGDRFNIPSVGEMSVNDDSQVIGVLKAMAIGPVAQGDEDQGGFECLFCEGESSPNFTEIDDVRHEMLCPIIEARVALRHKGIRPKVYKVTGERVAFTDSRGEHWVPFTYYTLGFDDNEPWFLWGGVRRRGVEATYVRELKPEEGGMPQEGA